MRGIASPILPFIVLVLATVLTACGPEPTPTATPNVQATVAAAVQATVAAIPTATPMPLPTPTPVSTPANPYVLNQQQMAQLTSLGQIVGSPNAQVTILEFSDFQ